MVRDEAGAQARQQRRTSRTTRPCARLTHTALALTVGFSLLSCSDPTTEASETPTTRRHAIVPTTRPESVDVLYIQHALLASAAVESGVTTFTMKGVDQVTVWSSRDRSGALTTEEFIAAWDELGLTRKPPWAVIVPADVNADRIAVQLSDPSWDAELRTIVYDAVVSRNPPAEIRGLIRGRPTAAIPEQLPALTLLILQDDAEVLPDSITTTTTTTTSLPPSTPSTQAPPTSPTDLPTTVPTPSTGTRAPTSPSTSNPASSPPTTAPPGPAVLLISPDRVEFPAQGGTRFLRIANAGSGVGSWSAITQAGTGMSVTPSSGFLLPGKSVELRVTYNGQGPASDFITRIQFVTSSGDLEVLVIVKE
ncbi:MAG: hypothetical protein KatS3mg008_0172 [Acidimicrobiales bacterium]|nr:MAG: hypothetical protein KatS3mg008_0172 [Acidimicrobiales bacterium]